MRVKTTFSRFTDCSPVQIFFLRGSFPLWHNAWHSNTVGESHVFYFCDSFRAIACMFHESRVLIQHFADCFTVRLLIFFAFFGNGLGVTECGKWPACFPRHPRPGAPHRASRAPPPSHASGKLAREFRATFESPRERPPRSNLRARSGTRVFRRGASAECAHEKSRRVARFSLAGDARLSGLSPPRPSRSRAFRVAARASFPRTSRTERFDSSRGHGDPLFHHRRRPGENHVRTRRDFPRETRSRGRRSRQHRRRRCRRARARGRPGELPLDPSPRPARVPAQGRSQEGAFPGSTPWRMRILAFRHSQKYLAPRCPPDVYFRARAEDDDATGSLPRDTSSDPYLPSPLLSPLARADFLGA